MGLLIHVGHAGSLWYKTLEGQTLFNMFHKLKFHNLICNVVIYLFLKDDEKNGLHFIKMYNPETLNKVS